MPDMKKSLEITTNLIIFTAGGPRVVGRACGVSPQAASQWKNSPGCIPAQHVETVAALSPFTAHEIRPDLYRKNGAKRIIPLTASKKAG